MQEVNSVKIVIKKLSFKIMVVSGPIEVVLVLFFFAACSFRRKRSWIIYCWLVWCEKKILFQFIIRDRIRAIGQAVYEGEAFY